MAGATLNQLITDDRGVAMHSGHRAGRAVVIRRRRTTLWQQLICRPFDVRGRFTGCACDP